MSALTVSALTVSALTVSALTVSASTKTQGVPTAGPSAPVPARRMLGSRPPPFASGLMQQRKLMRGRCAQHRNTNNVADVYRAEQLLSDIASRTELGLDVTIERNVCNVLLGSGDAAASAALEDLPASRAAAAPGSDAAGPAAGDARAAEAWAEAWLQLSAAPCFFNGLYTRELSVRAYLGSRKVQVFNQVLRIPRKWLQPKDGKPVSRPVDAAAQRQLPQPPAQQQQQQGGERDMSRGLPTRSEAWDAERPAGTAAAP
eukprot:364235-Chlamydomonas_euryale.AAC.1